MKKIKKLLIVFFTITLVLQAKANDAPASFADLAERLMPSVVNISTTTICNYKWKSISWI